MKPQLGLMLLMLALLTLSWSCEAEVPMKSSKYPQPGYIIDNDSDVATRERPPHEGEGMSMAFSYFKAAKDLKLIFRKRVMEPGSSVGYHEQTHDEIYYVVSGTGDLGMNEKIIPVGPGDAILTLAGSWHGLQQTGNEELVFFIVYEEQDEP